jgi:hypothetical protein
MVEEEVLVQIEGGMSFTAEVLVDVEEFDPNNMPPRLTGAFTKLPSSNPSDTVNTIEALQLNPRLVKIPAGPAEGASPDPAEAYHRHLP